MYVLLQTCTVSLMMMSAAGSSSISGNNTDIISINYSSLFLKNNLKRSYGLRTELKVGIKTEINF